MPRPKCSRIETDPAHDDEVVSPAPDTPPGTLSVDQIRGWAALIADGRDEVPTDLAAVDCKRLQAEVRRWLRDRMVRLVARAIAMNLHREFGKK